MSQVLADAAGPFSRYRKNCLLYQRVQILKHIHVCAGHGLVKKVQRFLFPSGFNCQLATSLRWV